MPERRTRRTASAINLAVLAVVTIASLALVEIGLRLAVGDASTTVLYRPDPDWIAQFRPDLDLLLRSEQSGQPVRLRTDGRGNRVGEEPPRAGDRRVVVYGDSNIAALFSPYPATYPARLGAELGPGFEVTDAGVVGFGPDQALLRMEKEYDELRPSLVIFHLFLDNDFGDLVRNRLVAVEGGRLVRTGRRETDPAFGLLPRLEAESLTVRYLLRGYDLLRQSLLHSERSKALARYLPRRQDVLDSLTTPGSPEGSDSPTARPASEAAALRPGARLRQAAKEVEDYRSGRAGSWLWGDDYDYDLALEPEGEGAGLKRELMRAVLAEAQRFVAGRGGRILFLLQPSIHDLGENTPIGPAQLAAASPAYRPRGREEFVREVLRGLGAATVSLWDPFVAAGPAGLYWIGDDHWNPAGMGLAARETARYVRGRWPELFAPPTKTAAAP
jgi:hypothetical protein